MRPTTFLPIIIIPSVAALIYPIFRPGTTCGRRPICLSKLKQQGTALAIYADDSDERFPIGRVWMDRLEPYAKDATLFHEDAVPIGSYGYAFNRGLSGALPPKRPEVALTVYDSTNLGRNASDFLSSLPPTGRHGGYNNVVFADSHAQRRRAAVGANE